MEKKKRIDRKDTMNVRTTEKSQHRTPELTLKHPELDNTIRVARASVKGKTMSQKELANHLGLSRLGVIKIEKGIVVPSTKTAIRMSQLFGINLEKLFILKKW